MFYVTHSTHKVGLLEKVISRTKRSLSIFKTQQTQQTNIHAFSGIRTLDPRSRTAAELRLRPQGHRDRLNVTLVQIIAKVAVVVLAVTEPVTKTCTANFCRFYNNVCIYWFSISHADSRHDGFWTF